MPMRTRTLPPLGTVRSCTACSMSTAMASMRCVGEPLAFLSSSSSCPAAARRGSFESQGGTSSREVQAAICLRRYGVAFSSHLGCNHLEACLNCPQGQQQQQGAWVTGMATYVAASWWQGDPTCTGHVAVPNGLNLVDTVAVRQLVKQGE